VKENIAFVVFITILFFTGAVGCGIAYILLDFIESDTTVANATLKARVGTDVVLPLPKVHNSDRIYLVLDTFSPVTVEADSPETLTQLPYDVEGLPYDYEDWILCKQRFLFIANGSANSKLFLSFKDPKTHYIAKAWQGKVKYTLFSYKESYVGVNISASTQQESRFQQVMLLFPYSQVATQNFNINGALKLIDGKIAYTNLILINDDRSWFSYQLVSNQTASNRTIYFNVGLYNETSTGQTLYNDFAKSIRYIAINIGLDSSQWTNEKEGHAAVGIGEIYVLNGNEKIVVDPEVSQAYIVNYDLYVFSKFTPTSMYILSILALIFLIIAGALMLAKLSSFKIKPRHFFKNLVLRSARSDPEPDTYLAKLFHKPRYDKLVTCLKKFAGNRINILVDVGCGKGVFRKWINRNGVNVVRYIGCDVDKEVLRKAKNIERISCDVQHLPFNPNVSEVTVCSEVLEHIHDPYSGFQEILRISKHWVFLSFPDEKVKNALGFRYPEHISSPDAAEFEHIASSNHWKLQEKEKMYSAFPPHLFDKLGLKYKSRYRPIITFFYQLLSKTTFELSLIKTILLIFEVQK